MTALAQIIAIEKGVKTDANRKITDAYHALQRPGQLAGLSRVYRPDTDDGEMLPSESVQVVTKGNDVLADLARVATRLFDVTLTKDVANQEATADVTIEDNVLLHDVPVTHLLFLEKQLGDLNTIIAALPVLDPAETWSYDTNAGLYRTEPQETRRTKKVERVEVVVPPTDKHPAQTHTYTEDVSVGTWTLTKFSGAVPADRKKLLLDRVTVLAEAVKFARQEANRAEIVDQHEGRVIFDYLLAE